MTSRAATIAVAVARCWLGGYTSGLPPQIGAERRAEITSDLWEMQHDPDWQPSALSVLGRVICGMPDDVAWRFTQATTDERAVVQRLLALSVAVGLVLALWTAPSVLATTDGEGAACRGPLPQTRTARLNEVVRCTAVVLSTSR